MALESVTPPDKTRAPRNRTLVLSEADRVRLGSGLLTPENLPAARLAGVVHGRWEVVVPALPPASFDLLFLDPPYNLDKDFAGERFARQDPDAYTAWLEDCLVALKPLLKPTASLYICGDWLSSHSIFAAARRHFHVRNRITWEREKGRGARRNWKNCTEDIWFCTVGEDYYFDLAAVKLRRRVLAPYKTREGVPKDWTEQDGSKFRDTHPSNLWTDITIPFWSMPENTDHPTQKSEKLLAKLLLASCPPGGWVLDPFLGSGTTAVVGAKLGRSVLGIEQNREYALLACRRLELAAERPGIQGFANGVFYERNSVPGV